MPLFFHKPRISYGLDISGPHLTVVKSIHTRKGIVHRVAAQATGQTALPVALRTEIEADIQAGRAVTSAAMPVLESFTRWLQTPLSSMAKAERVLPSLLDIQLPFPLESCQYRFPAFRRTPNGPIDALAVATPTALLQSRMEIYRQAGHDPLIVDHEGLALWTQSVEEIPLERNAVRIVAYLGHDRTVLVLGRGADYLSAQALRIGIDHLFPNGASHPADSIRSWSQRVRHILRALPLDFRSGERHWLWTGPGAAREESTRELGETLRDETDLHPLTHRDPVTFLARALSERQLSRAAFPCNLRGGAAAHPGASHLSDRAHRRSLVALAAGGVLLVAINLGWLGRLGAVSQDRQDRISRLASRLADMPKPPRGQELMIVQRALANNDELQNPFLRAFQPSLFMETQRVLRFAHELNIRLERLDIKDDLIVLRGAADDWDRCEQLSRALGESGYSVSLDRQDAGADERVPFALTGRRSP